MISRMPTCRLLDVEHGFKLLARAWLHGASGAGPSSSVAIVQDANSFAAYQPTLMALQVCLQAPATCLHHDVGTPHGVYGHSARGILPLLTSSLRHGVIKCFGAARVLSRIVSGPGLAVMALMHGAGLMARVLRHLRWPFQWPFMLPAKCTGWKCKHLEDWEVCAEGACTGTDWINCSMVSS